ncbi:G-protein coupled receptor Mth2 like protein [Argiope bruennichi]|uniref:G-protein coupled receptor Mth2 like protein n=1 Tax=Argiope bruennichi TaxID=94029 RepID=A0A8T0EGL7_ARGBR|nr:G-protein coupled receptor Mth2 like protein [Argiope bruennichi]
MCLVSVAVAILLSLHFCLVPALPDERETSVFHDKVNNFLLKEQELFQRLGICRSENQSIAVCDIGDTQAARNLTELQRSSCQCDDQCFLYQDCCINKVPTYSFKSPSLSCRQIRGEDEPWIHIYVYQQCPTEWTDEFVKEMCETEAVVRDQMGLPYDHLQDLPVKSESTGRFYRNIYCAICNDDTWIVKWKTYFYCNGDSQRPENSLMDEPDFSNAYYSPHTKNFRKVRIGDKLKNCVIVVKDFELSKLLFDYGARLCKRTISSCPVGTSEETSGKCNSYTSYVYINGIGIYRNFHCALCNGIPVSDIICNDPFYPPLRSAPPWAGSGRSALTMLFDFNFAGGLEEVGRLSPCLIQEGQVWDPIFRKCQNFTCGSLYKKEGSKCVPLDISKAKGLKDSCPKIILAKENFNLQTDGSVFINITGRHLSEDEYEVHKKEGKEIVEIVICADEVHLLPYSIVHSWVSLIVLIISIICLILHLTVYGLLEKLRNRPGKILMSLAVSLLCGHLFLLLGPNFRDINWMCYTNGVMIHFGYIAAFSWMSVMAYDIHETFTVTQTNNSKKSKLFQKYSLYAWIFPLSLIALSITMDQTLPIKSDFRPKYAEFICWLNSRKGLLIFFVVPATCLLIANIILFSITAFHIRKVSRQTRMVNNFSDKVRYFLYLKLSVVLGLTWILGLVAGLTRMDAFWYPFIILNGLQGALIFIAFTIKRNILHMLAVKLKIRSDKYRMGKRSGIKAAMYSSLSNLTTLQTSVSSQIPTVSKQQEMLKAVRKINPDEALAENRT